MKLVGLTFLWAACLLAQNAQISGLVKDPSNAVLPNATVTVLNKDTGSKRVSPTNNEGLYSVVGLNPGRYQVLAVASGFQTATRDNVILEVAENARLDFVLEVGRNEQSVTINADSSSINTSDGAVSTTIGRDMVDNLPLNGRSFQQLFTLTPGVSLSPASSVGQFIVNGQRSTSNYVTVDGVSANTGVFPPGTGVVGSGSAVAGGNVLASNAAGGTNSLVSVDALQEFRILTSSFSPEYGRTPGGQIILLTRSGNNTFHGTLFEYFRNDKLDATNWFVDRQAQPKPALRVNNFGGTLGGPVIRNRTFFFVSYEGDRLRQPSFGISVVPSLASRQSAPAATQGILDAFPMPNGPNLANSEAQYSAGYSNPITTDAFSVRVDHTFSPKLTAFGRYSYAPSESQTRPGGNIALSVVLQEPNGAQSLTLGTTYVISSRAVNETRLNFTENSFSAVYRVDNLGGATPLPASAFPAPLSPSNSVTEITLAFTGGTLFTGISAGTKQRQINPTDTLSYTIGSHQLKAGIDYRQLLPLTPPQDGILYGFNGVAGVDNNLITSFEVGYQARVVGEINNFSSFAQDTWRMTGRLTLTYGFRWEVNTPPSDRDPNNGNYVPLVGNYAIPSTVHAGTAGSALWNTQYRNFAPRLGVAYQLRQSPGWETVIRSGAGLFYDLGNGGAAIDPWTLGFPNNLHVTLSRVPFPISSSQAVIAPVNLSNPAAGQKFYGYPDDLKLPRTWQWNVSVQQALGAAQTFTASYVAALGRDLLYPQVYDGLTAQNYTLTYTTNAGYSDYQGLQLQFQRRLYHGLSATAAYTWSHSLDSTSADVASLPPTEFLGTSSNKGPSDFDLRHSFSGALTWDLPGARTSWLRPLARGWGLDTIITARSALPFDVTSARNIGYGSFSLRPELVLGVPLWLTNPDVAAGRQLNPAAFAVPATSQGDLGRNAIRGFDLAQVDLSIRRTFHLREKLRLLVRGDLFNVLNHPNFANPVGDLGSGLFGQSTSLQNSQLGGGATYGLNSLFQIGGPRSVQLSLKLIL